MVFASGSVTLTSMSGCGKSHILFYVSLVKKVFHLSPRRSFCGCIRHSGVCLPSLLVLLLFQNGREVEPSSVLQDSPDLLRKM